MSSIYKLSISGIRSFSDETQETIQFGKPLTLIVGTNGSGKTTIIECLRYATTNELPPNTKNGASFINDPNLHSSNETKAQIKLAFQNTKKVNLILSKSLMATKNPRTKTISFKTKENQLMSINHGERQTLSSKVADIENLIPQHLGVSKSILNYVVFCHQDESLWPISESSVLKKKFDEIFDSSKFIKILDSIKGITKEINSDIKLINNDVEHLKNDKIRSVNKKNSIHLLEKQIETNRNLMVKLKSNLEQLNNELQKLYTSNQDYERTISQLESLEKDKANVMKNMETLKLTIDLINKPKELLLNDLNNFADVIADQIQKCNTLQNQIDGKIQELNELRKTLNTMHMQIGNFEALHKQNIDNITKKEEMIEQFKQQLEIENVSQFDSKLDMKLQTLKENYDTQKKKYDDLLSTLENQLMDAKLEQSKEMQHLEYLQTDINSMSTKLNELKSRYASIAGNEIKLQTLREEHDRKLAAFRKLKEMNEIANLNALIETDTKKINLFEFDLEENQRKLQMARINNDLMSKINVLKEINDLSNREMEVALLKILQIVPDISKSDLVSKYKELIESTEIAFNRKRADVETVKFKKSKAMMSLENNQQVETQYKSEMKKLSNHFKALQIQFKNIYGDNLELNKYLHTVDNVENDYNEDFEDFKNFQFLITFNERAIQTAENKTSCLLCRRTFDEENGDGGCGQKSKFVEMLKNRNLELVSRIGAEETLSKKEGLLNKLRDFKGDSVKLVELETTKLAEIEKQIQENKQANFDLDTEIDLFCKELLEINDRLNKLKMIEQDVNIFNNQNSSIKDRTEQIQRLSDKLAEQGLTQENYEDLEKNNKQLYNDLKTARISLESLKLDRDMKQKRNNELENDINQVKLSINDLELKSLDKINIEKAISETETQLNSNIKSYNDCKIKLNSFQENIEAIQFKYSTQTNVSDNALIEVQKEIENYDKIKKYFAKIDEEIQSYITNNIEAKFTQCSEIIKSGNENVEMKEGEITSLQHDLKKLEALVSNSSNQERNIRSNLNLMQLEEDLVSIAGQINQLDATQAYVQRTNFLKRTSELQDVQNNYQKELATKLGESSQLERQIKEMKTELNRDYKDIDKKYVCEYAKLQTKLAMATDLTTLYKVTDNGVMEFHQSQMKKINNILDELWKKTYMGNDVETIKIKADPIAAKKTSTTTASNNRSYNYRVVMIKNGTELDMRGRCSAGQRVLASIIIRIALAECFCLNFGMIALDEPTTNLDDENIESLARALHAIIRERSTQRNFQLIIITHDEKFLRCMNAVDFTDHYYKVMRDERLNSTINKVSIATVTE